MNELRRIEQLAFASMTDEVCPETELLARSILGELSGTEQLRVAAHVRGCPLCQSLIETARPPEAQAALRPQIARLMPLLSGAGRRSSVQRTDVRRYVVADLVIELTIPPPDGELWRLTGLITRSGVPVANTAVTLKSGRRRTQAESDALGFFTFADVPPGNYTLIAAVDQIQTQIRDLTLATDLEP